MLNVRFDTPQGTGSFGETLNRRHHCHYDEDRHTAWPEQPAGFAEIGDDLEEGREMPSDAVLQGLQDRIEIGHAGQDQRQRDRGRSEPLRPSRKDPQGGRGCRPDRPEQAHEPGAQHLP